MYSLRVEDDRGEIRKVVVDKDVYTIGRTDDNDLVLTDINISRHHARLEVRPMGIVLVDPGSTYGIRMNGLQAPSEVMLQGGDVFVLGDYRFELAPAEEGADLTASSTIRMTKLRQEKAAEAAKTVPVAAAPIADNRFGNPETVALSEEESYKILMSMRATAMAGLSSAGGGSDSGDEPLDDETAQAIRRGRMVSTLTLIFLVGAALIIGWLLYMMFAQSDPYLGRSGVPAPTGMVAGLSDDVGFPRS